MSQYRLQFKMWIRLFIAICPLGLAASCGLTPTDSSDGDANQVDSQPAPRDPDTTARAVVDRFTAEAGTLFVRDDANGLPAADGPIDFDEPPFITRGLGPTGTPISYYNFDVQPTLAAAIYVLQRDGESEPVAGQLNVVDVVPGDEGYSDFWNVRLVTVPSDYVANTITSVAAITEGGYSVETTDVIVNCPIVPDGSTAIHRLGGESPDLTRGWYRDQVITYFGFMERPLTAVVSAEGAATVPVADIFVTFNVNPGEEGGGPSSGPMLEPGTDQSHNVAAFVPSDSGYSPLWIINVYDNADFDSVIDLPSAQAADLIPIDTSFVNCPIVIVEGTP